MSLECGAVAGICKRYTPLDPIRPIRLRAYGAPLRVTDGVRGVTKRSSARYDGIGSLELWLYFIENGGILGFCRLRGIKRRVAVKNVHTIFQRSMKMKEQNEKEQEKVKEKEKNNGKEKGKKCLKNNERKFYLFTAIGCAVALLAVIIVAVVVGGAENVSGNLPPVDNVGNSSSQPDENVGKPDDGDNDNDEPVVSVPEGMISPIAVAVTGNGYGFHHNQTLNNYFVHAGLDFMADAGTEVLAVEDGVVESIYKDDILLGTEIVIAHADGVKSKYRFVTEKEGLKVGDSVKKGDIIAVVAEATGNEYKDGAHLHFEITENGVKVDPTTYLTLEEK